VVGGGHGREAVSQRWRRLSRWWAGAYHGEVPGLFTALAAVFTVGGPSHGGGCHHGGGGRSRATGIPSPNNSVAPFYGYSLYSPTYYYAYHRYCGSSAQPIMARAGSALSSVHYHAIGTTSIITGGSIF